MKRGKYNSPYYTIYDNDTDNILAFGRSDECAAMLGITIGSFHSIVSRARNPEAESKYAVVIERMAQ